MPTAQTHVVGTGETHTTIASFISALPANLVTADEIWTAQLKNQEFSESPDFGSPTTDATRFIRIEAASGAGFADVIGSNPLSYDGANGAAVTSSDTDTFKTSADYTEIENIQIQNTSGYNRTGLNISASNCKTDNCIVNKTAGGAQMIRGDGVGSQTNNLFRNLLVTNEGTGSATGISFSSPGTGHKVLGCTFLAGDGSAARGTGVSMSYGTDDKFLVNGCLFLNFSSDVGYFPIARTSLGDYNATDIAAASSNLNGANNLYGDDTSPIDANEIVELTVATGLDGRLASGAECQGANASPDTDHLSTDILGTTRSTYDIGCFELAAAGGGGPVRHMMQMAA